MKLEAMKISRICIVISIVLVNLLFLVKFSVLGVQPGPEISATRGKVWPQPLFQIYHNSYVYIDPSHFTFTVTGETCDILEKAIDRYNNVLKDLKRLIDNTNRKRGLLHLTVNYPIKDAVKLDRLNIFLKKPCESRPHNNMDERYQLQVNSSERQAISQLNSKSIWGILRGLETFIQLLSLTEGSNMLFANCTTIKDSPRFPYRGLLLDTARHFMPMRTIYSILNGMAMNKMNVFHWHIVDDQSFPFVSQTWPELSKLGAYSPLHVYNASDVQNIVEYARLLGIRVIPEFDTPGHTRSWGQGYPELLVPCYSSDQPDGTLGPMNPLNNFTYDFMKFLMTELEGTFPDENFHLGGDEVDFACWESNPDILQYLQDNHISAKQLQNLYIQRILTIANNMGIRPIVWEEVFESAGARLPNSTIVQAWKSWTNYKQLMSDITKRGLEAIFSACWYLDHLDTGGDWMKYYDCDPLDFPGTSEQKKFVVGGEACMWAEVVDATNVETRIWPRAAAIAEKLWSPPHNTDETVERRLEEHACRMNLRRIPTQPPNGPGFCPMQLYS